MRLLQTVPPAAAVTLAEAKAHLRITHDLENDLITRMISAAGARAEREAGAAFGSQTWQAVLSEFPAENIELDFGPVTAVTSIVYVDSNGAAQTLEADAYELQEATRLGVIVPIDGWPTAGTGSNAVTVTFTAGNGWTEEMRQAVLLILAHWYGNRETAVAGALTEIPYGASCLIGLNARMFV